MHRLLQHVGIRDEVSIVREIRERELRVYTDAGRVMRPLFVVDRPSQQVLITQTDVDKLQDWRDWEGRPKDAAADIPSPEPYVWQDLLKEGKVEYLDAEEEESLVEASLMPSIMAVKLWFISIRRSGARS
ncbi:MAG: hypothetical protein EOP83_26285, partial [Verrucomicrobiaceae bacterium]